MRQLSAALFALLLSQQFSVGSATGSGSNAPAPARMALETEVLALRSPGPDQVLIPGGTFTMGSAEADVKYAIALCHKEPRGDDVCEKLFVNEMEAHEVTLSPYFIERTEVTRGAYRRCVDLGRCAEPPYASGASRFDRPDYPVTLITWNEADQYCRFLGGRLPTEAEWERAARGAVGRRFPWGNLYNKSLANHGSFGDDQSDSVDDGDGFAEMAPVGSFPLGRTPDGIDDLAGNVEEWVADPVDELGQYSKTNEVNPKGLGSGVFRLTRGGAYAGAQAGAPWLRGAARGFPHLASDREPYRGFRCVHPVSGEL